MKKLFVMLSMAGLLLGAFSLSSCKEKVKTVRGKVTSVDYNGDTLLSMKVSADGEEYVFSLDEAQFNNGVMLVGDSLIVNYFNGRHDMLRAAYVTLLPRPVNYLKDEVDKSKPLKTAPAPAE